MDMTDQHSPTQGKPGATPYDNYVTGTPDRFGKLIKYVIGRHRTFVVYVTEEYAVSWDYDHLPEHLRPAIATFQQLNGIARSAIGKKQFPVVASVLGAALYAALLSNQSEELEKHFKQARNFIYSKATQVSRLIYVLLSIFFGVVIVMIVFGTCKYFGVGEDVGKALLLGIAGGTTGSVVSIIRRAKDLEIDPLDSAIIIGFNGLSRVALGAILGVLLVAASKSNIALGHFSDNAWALFGLAAGAGFTERWIPELLGPQSENRG